MKQSFDPVEIVQTKLKRCGVEIKMTLLMMDEMSTDSLVETQCERFLIKLK